MPLIYRVTDQTSTHEDGEITYVFGEGLIAPDELINDSTNSQGSTQSMCEFTSNQHERANVSLSVHNHSTNSSCSTR
jgi:hypothetical protein